MYITHFKTNKFSFLIAVFFQYYIYADSKYLHEKLHNYDIDLRHMFLCYQINLIRPILTQNKIMQNCILDSK